jgi:hypothetical protein
LLRRSKVCPHIGGEGARVQLLAAALVAARQAAASNASRWPGGGLRLYGVPTQWRGDGHPMQSSVVLHALLAATAGKESTPVQIQLHKTPEHPNDRGRATLVMQTAIVATKPWRELRNTDRRRLLLRLCQCRQVRSHGVHLLSQVGRRHATSSCAGCCVS